MMTQANTGERISVLKEQLGSCVLTEKESCFRASFDGMRLSFMPEAVIKVTEESQVGSVLKLANKYEVPVVARGSGSTLTGSATPVCGGWVLDMSQLKSIQIDRLNSMAYVGVGAITADIQAAAEKEGLFYPPDPASIKFCTIGGNIACNAGGLRCVKYGVTRDYVLALRGYLPTGEAVSWGRPLKKFAVAYNLRDLWIGAEGTLGVITHAVLKLIPKPSQRWTCLAIFKDETAALQGAQELLKAGVVPSILEFLDRLTVKGVDQYEGSTQFKELSNRAVLLIEIDGPVALIKENQIRVQEWANKHADSLSTAESAEETEKLWHVRRQCSIAMFQHGDTKLNEDVVVPISKTPALMDCITELSQKFNLKIPTFGHAGDGNLHINIMYYRKKDGEEQRAAEALMAVMKKVVQLGGAITGEHGIGLAKTDFLRLQYNEDEINVMLRIKKALDSKGILNPNKIFKPFHPWEHSPVDVRMPWDKTEGKS